MTPEERRTRYARIARDNPDRLPEGSVIVVLNGKANLIVNDDGSPTHVRKIWARGA